MPSTPTTKSQVQAYRFVLRRMQSALVRKDAVMLHDPMRTHSRATMVGAIVGAIVLIGFLVVGLLAPAPSLPTADGIIIGEQSGTVYVFTANPQLLTPTFNLASARLLMMAKQNNGNGQQPASQQATSGGQGPVEPTVVPDDKLAGVPRGRLTGIQNGPQLLPSAGQRIDDHWAVCDQYILNKDLNDETSENKIETTVLGGVDDLGGELNPSSALLVQSPDKKTYLVYRTPLNANISNANTVKAEVDMANPHVVSALRLNPSDTRQITSGLVNSIPPAPPLKAPDIGNRGAPPTVPAGGMAVGTVFSVEVAGGKVNYYVVLAEGVQQIKQTTADLIRFEKSDGGEEIRKVRPDELSGFKQVSPIDESKSPDVVPEVLTALSNPVVCLGWQTVKQGGVSDVHTEVHVGNQIPSAVPRDGRGTPQWVAISTPSPDGRLDHFYIKPGFAAVVRGSSSKEDFQTGPIYLVSDRGVKFGVPDANTANALGLSNQLPAPDSIMRLLPNGASLNTRDVLQTFDTVPEARGVFPSATPTQ